MVIVVVKQKSGVGKATTVHILSIGIAGKENNTKKKIAQLQSPDQTDDELLLHPLLEGYGVYVGQGFIILFANG